MHIYDGDMPVAEHRLQPATEGWVTVPAHHTALWRQGPRGRTPAARGLRGGGVMQLTTLLERLKMDHLLTQLDPICEQASKADLDYKAFLTQALAVEWRGRYQHGVESRLKQARFPWVKTVDQFDFAFQPSIDRKVIRELAGLSFLERTENVVLLGPPGVGKTHLGIALGVKAVEAGFSVLFLTFETLMTRLVRARHENRLERTLPQLVYPRLLILDELGYLPLSREEASLFFRLTAQRRCGNAGPADLGHLATRDAHIPTSASSSMTGQVNR